MINPREFLRRLLKIFILVSLLVIALFNTNKLSNDDIITVTSIVVIIYCILDTMAPSIEIKKV